MKEHEEEACLKLAQHFTGCNISNEYLVRAIISNTRRRIQTLELDHFVDYVYLMIEDRLELLRFLNNTTIHTTFWFREERHFELLIESIKESKKRNIKINSLACSTGEEAYSLAFICEELVEQGVIDEYQIDASDIDLYSILRARKGIYNVTGISRFIRDFSRFYKIEGKEFTIDSKIRERISFKKENLLELNESGPYDFIFARNVLIYFDFLRIKKIIRSVGSRLKDDGVFVIGHCESLDLGEQNQFTLMSHSRYQKVSYAGTESISVTRPNKKKVLCLDDSETMLKVLEKRLSNDFELFLVTHYKEADKVLKDHVIDHIILDLNMPEMSGDEYLKRLRRRNKFTPVLILSEVSAKEAQKVVGSLMTKNVDFLNKSKATRLAIFEKLQGHNYLEKNSIQRDRSAMPLLGNENFDAILIGGSTGAIPVITDMLSNLSKPHLPIVIIEHIESSFAEVLAESMSEVARSPLGEIKEHTPLECDHIYLAKKDAHLIIDQTTSGQLEISYGDSGLCDGHRPSITKLFESASRTSGKFASFLLSGMGKDGASGLLDLNRQGSLTITQEENSCVVFGMPKVALEYKASQYQLTPDEMSKLMLRISPSINSNKKKSA